jgi:hypothetical protein
MWRDSGRAGREIIPIAEPGALVCRMANDRMEIHCIDTSQRISAPFGIFSKGNYNVITHLALILCGCTALTVLMKQLPL